MRPLAPLLLLLVCGACNALVGYGDFTKTLGADAGTDDDDDSVGQPRDSGAVGSGEVDAGPGGCDMATPFDAPVLLAGSVNSGAFENAPALTDDELTLFFQRTIDNDHTVILLATRTSIEEAFGDQTQPALSVADLHFQPAVTRDGLSLFWSEPAATGLGLDIFVATRTTVTQQFNGGLVTRIAKQGISELGPMPSSDGNELFFSSDELAPGKPDKATLFRATRIDGEFQNPSPVTELASDGSEKVLTLSKDGLTAYFGSTRSGGKGDIDVWTATRPSIGGKFTNIRNVAEVNGPTAEWPSFLSADGCRLYLASSRSGDGDLYVAKRAR